MAFSSTLKPVTQTTAPVAQPSHNVSDVLLSLVLLSMYGAQMSKKTVRKLKRKFFFTALKLKIKSFFKPRDVSDRTLIYILLGVALVALLIIDPVLVLALAAVVLILILAGVI